MEITCDSFLHVIYPTREGATKYYPPPLEASDAETIFWPQFPLQEYVLLRFDVVVLIAAQLYPGVQQDPVHLYPVLWKFFQARAQHGRTRIRHVQGVISIYFLFMNHAG